LVPIPCKSNGNNKKIENNFPKFSTTKNQRIILQQKNSKIVTALKLCPDYEKKYVIFIEICMKRNHFACIKGK